MELLRQNNYVVVPNFISPAYAGILAQQMHSAGLINTDPQAPLSPSIYNFFPLVKLLVKKIQVVSEIIQEDVLPTYVYARIYKNGEILHRHRDRDACEISMTLNLQKDVDWPIWIQKPSGEEVAVELNPGDAMLYLGRIADHWRDSFTGNNCVQAFLHYVRANGECAYTYFDRAN